MTRTTNARVAGLMFLLYIATGIGIMILSGQATAGDGVAAKLTSIAQHALQMRLTVVVGFLSIMYALVLGVTLHSLTRDVDPDLAMLAMICRVCEGVLGAVPILATLGLLWLSTTGVPPANALGDFLFKVQGWNTLIAATFFAVGSTLFCWLFLRGRLIPVVLAWLGIVASVLLVVGLPLQLAGFFSGPVTAFIWIPMALFEIPLGFWLLIKGIAVPARR
jgi:hypothetical protein